MKVLFAALAAVFSFAIYWAFMQKTLSESGALLMGDPWGIVTLADLYIGFLIFAIFMYFTVPSRKTLLLWIPALLILGNLVSLVYLVFYYKNLTHILEVQNENK